MAHGWTRRQFAIGAGAVALAAPSLSSRAGAAAADAKTLRFITAVDLRMLDPVGGGSYVTRNHGYMVFDTLFAIDDKFRPQPQMVGEWDVSPDKLRYSFVLRDGLTFHDGQPVRASTARPR